MGFGLVALSVHLPYGLSGPGEVYAHGAWGHLEQFGNFFVVAAFVVAQAEYGLLLFGELLADNLHDFGKGLFCLGGLGLRVEGRGVGQVREEFVAGVRLVPPRLVDAEVTHGGGHQRRRLVGRGDVPFRGPEFEEGILQRVFRILLVARDGRSQAFQT